MDLAGTFFFKLWLGEVQGDGVIVVIVPEHRERISSYEGDIEELVWQGGEASGGDCFSRILLKLTLQASNNTTRKLDLS